MIVLITMLVLCQPTHLFQHTHFQTLRQNTYGDKHPDPKTICISTGIGSISNSGVLYDSGCVAHRVAKLCNSLLSGLVLIFTCIA